MQTSAAITPQAQMQAKLAQAGIPHKEIRCYGQQIVVTSWSRDAADSWAQLLGQFAKVRAVVKSIDERHDAKSGALGGRKYVPVFRTFATLEA